MRVWKKIPNCWRCDFFNSAQTVAATRQNAFAYDEGASGSIIYTYVGGNPLRWTDPRGLAIILPGPIPLPVPGPVTPPSGSKGDDGSGGGLFPPGTFPTPKPTIPTIKVPPFPPSSGPPQNNDGICELLLKSCQKTANACPSAIQPGISGLCFGAYLICKMATAPHDPPTPPAL